jgi:signal peptidase
VRKLISTLITIVLGVGWFIWLRPVQFNGPATYVIVSGESMEPTLYEGDLVILQRQDQYAPGDIVAYRIRGGNIIHRITDTSDEGFILQGDNKNAPDEYTPSEEEVLGKMWLHFPRAGRLVQSLQKPLALAVAAGLLTFIIMLASGGGEQTAAAQPGVFDKLWVFIVEYVSGSKEDFRILWRKAQRPVEENLEYMEYQSFSFSDDEQEPEPTPDGLFHEVGRFVRFHINGFIRDVRILWRRFKQERRENQ